MDARTLNQLAASPAAFRDALCCDHADSYGKSLRDWQRENHAAMDAAWMAIAGRGPASAAQYWRQYLELCRGSAKTLSEAVDSCYVLFAATSHITGVAAACDLDQSRLLRDAIVRLVGMNPWLGEFLQVDKYRISNRHTGSELHIISSDASSAYGWLIDFAICDEVSTWPEKGGRDMWDAIASSIAKKPRAAWCVAGNAGWQNSWQHDIRELIRTDPRWRFVQRSEPAEWITAENLSEQKRLLIHAAYQRLWCGVWANDAGVGLNQTEIDRTIDLVGPVLFRPQHVEETIIGVDLSYSRDHSAVVCLGVNLMARRIILLDRARFDPRDFPDGMISFAAIREKIIEFRDRFRTSSGPPGIRGDSFQSIALFQQLVREDRFENVEVRPTSSSAKNVEASLLLNCLRERRLSLYECPLVDDLRRAKIVEKPTGLSVVSQRDAMGHGDELSAMLAVLPACCGEIEAFAEEFGTAAQATSDGNESGWGPEWGRDVSDDIRNHGGWESRPRREFSGRN